MNSQLHLALSRAVRHDAPGRPDAPRPRRRAAKAPGVPVTLRPARRGELLVADVDGRVVAACALAGESAFCGGEDPWILDLLRLRAAELRRLGDRSSTERGARGG
jgi:hypothetical protein